MSSPRPPAPATPGAQDAAAATCPRCGGTDVRDLTRIRRGTGMVLTALAALALALEAASGTPVPGWLLGATLATLALGLVAWAGARNARYCPRCNVRIGRRRDQG